MRAGTDTDEAAVGGRGDVLLESVPNISTARDQGAIGRVVAAIEAGGGAVVADTHSDVDHDRTVLTVFGSAVQLPAALAAGVAEAVACIDVSRHEGVHPRVGAVDVVPIVPLEDLVDGGGDERDAQAACQALIDACSGLDVPIVRYGAGTVLPTTTSIRPARRASAQLAAALANGTVRSESGCSTMHPTAGATLIGVRRVLVAFNVELASSDVACAQHIAGVIRERDGGLAGVRALGVPLPGRATVQVSTNIDDWRTCGPAEVLERVCDLAGVLEVPVRSAELVGLAPQDALHDLRIACRRNRVRLRAVAEPALEIKARLAWRKLARRAAP